MYEKYLSTENFGNYSNSHPIAMGGGTETMYNQINLIFSKE